MGKQMSDSLPVVLILTLVGGFQDAYSYHIRSHVFANAQTGNIVLLAQKLILGHFGEVWRYLFPIIAFILGVFVSERLRYRNNQWLSLHWRQLVLGVEILFIFIVGFLPSSLDNLANAILSFVCAMQVNTFRKMRGLSLATTMCIGNLRTGTEFITKYTITKDWRNLINGMCYFLVIFIFGVGAALGYALSEIFLLKSIWFAAVLLVVAFSLMFKGKKKA